MARRRQPHDPAKVTEAPTFCATISTAGCLGKISYPNRAKAEKARRSICHRKGGEPGRPLQPYHCTKCGSHHLGRKGGKLANPRPKFIPDIEEYAQ